MWVQQLLLRSWAFSARGRRSRQREEIGAPGGQIFYNFMGIPFGLVGSPVLIPKITLTSIQMLIKFELKIDAPVAQLDRAPDYGSGGWGFDSLRAR